MPFAISANVPMSSSATMASPMPPPITPPVVLPIIFLPTLVKLKDLPALLAAMALLAIDLANLSPSLKPNFLASSKVALLLSPAASLVPALAPKAKPETASGAI